MAPVGGRGASGAGVVWVCVAVCVGADSAIFSRLRASFLSSSLISQGLYDHQGFESNDFRRVPGQRRRSRGERSHANLDPSQSKRVPRKCILGWKVGDAHKEFLEWRGEGRGISGCGFRFLVSSSWLKVVAGSRSACSVLFLTSHGALRVLYGGFLCGGPSLKRVQKG